MEKIIIIFIGKILLYSGGSAAVAYGLFRFLGKRWIENKFAKRLESYKHAQNKELEKLRLKINIQFSRITKIHEKEFDILPEAWLKMQDALSHIGDFTSPYQEFTDFNKLGAESLNNFLSKTELQEFEKQEMREAKDKNEYFQNWLFWHTYGVVRKKFYKFHTFIDSNRIFFSSDLQKKFTKIDEIMWSAIINRKVGYQAKKHEMWTIAYKKIKDDVEPIKKEIEALVQKRLHFLEVE